MVAVVSLGIVLLAIVVILPATLSEDGANDRLDPRPSIAFFVENLLKATLLEAALIRKGIEYRLLNG